MVGHLFRGIFKRVRCMSWFQEESAQELWKLVPLTPNYIPKEHGGYVAAIEAALTDDQVRNIALSGNYGVGKSSILREVARRHNSRVVELSLSTLAPIEAPKLDKSVPIQATTPTNLIQQEIVKQLLYREYPSRTPGSRFLRIERFRWWRTIGASVLLGFVVAVIFLLTGWTVKIATLFTPYVDIGIWAHPTIWSAAALVALAVNWLFYGKLRISQLSAGTATVTLSDNSVSYFDQYLDEIVYIFEVSGRDVVIFEDIDRFDDSHIFETLRALNTLLNVSPQIKRPIRFVYAIKDSIFDRIGLEKEGRKDEPNVNVSESDDPAQVESMRANRTKFFDLVIPVVPFITHRSARDLATQQLDGIAPKVAPELLDLAAQYVPDMRLLKNVRNEFIVFRDRIFSGNGKQLDLSETELFAMMLYKSTHLTDFEMIRLGTSKLDVLYTISRELVNENIKKLEGERRDLRQRLARKNGAKTRSTQLGGLLLDHIEQTINSISGSSRGRNGFTWSIDGSQKSDSELRSVDFWTAFVSADGDPELQQRITVAQSHNSYNCVLKFSRSRLVAALGDPLDMESWNEEDRESLTALIDEKAEGIKFLRSADLSDLVKRPEFLIVHDGSERSFDAVVKDILKSRLAYQLIRAGYINRNLTLYTSTFHGTRVTTSAMNFIIRHVERDQMDEHFELTPDDVDAVIRERGNNALKEPALYNIAILDHLLATNVGVAGLQINSLTSLGEKQERFLLAYLSAGNQRTKFIERLTVVFSQTLVYLVSHADLDDASRLELVGVALAHLSTSKQKADAAVSAYLSAHYADFPVLTSDPIDERQAERIGELFAAAGIIVPRLEPLSRQIRASFVARNLYEITYENLTVAIENTATVALDVIRAINEIVYKYVLDNLNTYIDIVDGVSATIDANEHFLSVLEDVLEQDAARIGDVIERAAPDCKVKDIVDVSEEVWSALAKHQRFPATFSNVSSYVSNLGSVDAHLASILIAANEMTEINDTDEETKTELAIQILAASDQIPSESRAQLVAGLNLQKHLDVEAISKEAGDLFALLLEQKIIADDVASYEYLATSDWPTRKAFILSSTKFKSYMTPELVQPDLAALLASDEIDSVIKDVIVEQADTYVQVAEAAGLRELANYATKNGGGLSPDVVQEMAHGDVPAQQVILLLERHLDTINRDQLFTILQALDGDYPELTEVGYGKFLVSNTLADRALLERLKRESIVSKYDERGTVIEVHRKRK